MWFHYSYRNVGVLAIALQSGSNGNCIYVESGETRLLFDAGISGRTAAARLAEFGRDIRNIDAVILSHDHTDHVRCAGVYHRMFGLPVFLTEGTFHAAGDRFLGTISQPRLFRRGKPLHIGDVIVETIPTPHDAAEGCAFVVTAEGKRLGILTDLGHVFPALRDAVSSLDAVLLESNYDPEMLDDGPYPGLLKRRIRGPGGHLSNEESAELLAECATNRMQWVCLSHLSEQNNSPGVATLTHRGVHSWPVIAASRSGAVALPAL